MPKKKTAKSSTRKTKVSRTHAAHTDDHSFLIIVGGGLVILMIVGLFLLNRQSMNKISANPMPVSAVSQKEKTVVIKDFAFSPQIVTVKVGTTVSWENLDTVAHSAVADDNTFNTNLLATGEKGSYTFTKAGTYTYKCSVHPSMTGTIIVEE